ncbi:hypothetical protein M2390_003148 [Mycetocola sp. BIGb0189]|uniref:hypothetical protein n=1 Tax=Mycetocola sp. BIGb0189 TaxID=2940604 RepID=UPI002166D1B9|nr:hypothetical protein [Mycetocola sp. BIGb0189]MCS4277932.1 hypothetical protein [Mycetocola sp. BIGb0189]
MSAAIECLQCGERQEAIRASQGTQNPIFCAGVDYFGETDWEADRHRFRDRSDRELVRMGVLPEYTHLYRRIKSRYEIADDHMVEKEASA